MDTITLIKTALEYYDKNQQKYADLLKNVKFIKFIKAEKNIDHSVVVFFDSDKKEIYRSRYEIIGVHNVYSNIWTWAWAIFSLKKNNTNIMRKIWNYGAVLDPSDKYLKLELITSRFRIDDPIQIDIHIAMSSYLSKMPCVYKYLVTSNSVIDDDGFIKTTGLHDIPPNDETYYYMFLLDYK